MIQTKELRLGNFVMDAVSGEWMIVDEIGENVGAVLINRDKYPLTEGWQMDYIPLTQEVLERCGCNFIGKVGYTWITPNGLRFQFYVKQISVTLENKWFHLDYLHQFQNLIFLTGEELEIKSTLPNNLPVAAS